MNIKQARKKLGLTQAQLATELGVAENTVARWERGERRTTKLHEMAMQLLMEMYEREGEG